MAPLSPRPSDGAGRVSKKRQSLQKKPTYTPDLPEPLQHSDEDEPDDHLPSQGPPMFMNMNQSIFGLIAAAGSKHDFTHRFDDDSGTDDEPDDDHTNMANDSKLTKTTVIEKKGRLRAFSGSKLLKSLPSLPKRRSKKQREREREASKLPSQPEEEEDEEHPESDDSSAHSPDSSTRRLPVMSRMLTAQAEMEARPSFEMEDVMGEKSGATDGHSPLAQRLMEIFEFDSPEQVVEEYPCWLLQSVLLQGFMYITAKHICFYAYLPKKAHVVAKSGYLSKSGKRNPKYNRYWFRLKGQVLSYYRDATNLYFPHGQIDLSFGISASITDKDKEGVHFEVVTHQRTYNFRADSPPSAKEWVKSLQRVIFRSHNEGDSVKISLPIDNVIDVEEMQMMAFADTCKIRVIDNDETYAIDEYFFSFFSFGREALNVLKILIDDASSGERTVDKVLGRDAKLEAAKARAATNPEPVKATLPPMSPQTQSSGGSPRHSADVNRTSFGDGSRFGRKSAEQSALGSSGLSRSNSQRHMKQSSDSFMLESGEPSYSNLAASEDASASQILQGSEVFQSPTMRRSYSGSRKSRQRDRPSPRLITTQPSDADSKYSSQMATTPTLQSISKMGAYPIQRAGALADFINKTGKRMSSMLAAESMGYVEKVSGMWKGGHKHYDGQHGYRPDQDDLEEDSEGQIQTSMERFRAHFALPETERLQATYFGYIRQVLPLYGKIYISDRSFCFRSLLPGTRTKLILPLTDIENVDKSRGFRLTYSGLVVVIRGHEELFFEFSQANWRDDCAVTLLQSLETIRQLKKSGEIAMEEKKEAEEALAEREALKEARQEAFPDHELPLPKPSASLADAPPILLDDPEGSFSVAKPAQGMKITCLTIGSRGDVQPYIALCLGLKAEGHHPRIATHGEFQGWIEGHGIEFARVEGDPAELMRLCIEHGTFTWAFLREANSTFRGWLDELLQSAWTACEGSDVLIESPSAMAGIHIAEKLGIPYFRAFTMPWTRTRAYPHAFIMPEHKMGGAYNYMTYIMFDNIFWKATERQVNRWRNKTLGLPNTNLEKLQPNKVPFLYNFSPSVVAPPLDFSDWIRVTGYWFLDEGGGEWQPPKELDDFIKQARADGKKIVYVGFGSIIVNDPAKMTQEVIDAVLRADVRCILSKGWSERVSKEDEDKPRPPEPEMPSAIHVIKSAPHDWLFRHIDAAAHHGGSGTTGASLRAGIPTIIRPFFGDQFFFASRIEDLGVGVWVKKWGTNSFGRALWEVTRNERMIIKARVLGEQIRKDKGVETAIQCIYRDYEYAKELIKRKAGKNAQPEDGQDGDGSGSDEDAEEESWTFVGGDEPDPEAMTKKLSEGLGLGLSTKEKMVGSQILKGM